MWKDDDGGGYIRPAGTRWHALLLTVSLNFIMKLRTIPKHACQRVPVRSPFIGTMSAVLGYAEVFGFFRHCKKNGVTSVTTAVILAAFKVGRNQRGP
jgi:hypothetical protein